MEFKGNFRLGVVWATVGAVLGFLGGGALLTVLGAAFGGADGGQFGMIGFLIGPPVGFFMGWRLIARRYGSDSERQTDESNSLQQEKRWVWALTGIPVGGILGCVLMAAGISILAQLHFINLWNPGPVSLFGWVGILVGLPEGAAAGWFLAGLDRTEPHGPPRTGNCFSATGMVRDVLYTLVALVAITLIPSILARINMALFIPAGVCTVALTAFWTGRKKTAGPDDLTNRWFLPDRPYLLGMGETLLAYIVFMALLRYGGWYGHSVLLLSFLCLSVFPILNMTRRKSLLVRGNLMGSALLVGARVLMLLTWMVSLALGYGSVP